MRLPILSAVLLAACTTAHYSHCMDDVEPTCEELRAIWRFTKRQSRVLIGGSAFIRDPFFADPFGYGLYEMWREFQARADMGPEFRGINVMDKKKSWCSTINADPTMINRGRRAHDDCDEPLLEHVSYILAHRRSAGSAPVYGRLVHKPPLRSQLRNAMRHRLRASDDKHRMFGTINRYPPATRQSMASFRVGGGGGGPVGLVPQAGSFQHLKEIIRAERARESKEQHLPDHYHRTPFFTADRYPSVQQPSRHPLTDNPGHRRYMSSVPNIGQAWSRSVPHTQDYISR